MKMKKCFVVLLIIAVLLGMVGCVFAETQVSVGEEPLKWNHQYDSIGFGGQWFTFSLKETSKVAFEFANGSVAGMHGFIIYDADHEQIVKVDAGPNFNGKKVVYLNAGKYYLYMQAVWTPIVYYNTISESFKEPTGGNNNMMGMANAVDLGKTYKGVVTMDDTCDYYKFKVPNDGNLTLNATSYSQWIYYIILDAKGNRVWEINPEWNADAKINKVSENVNLKAGTYYLEVMRDGNGIDRATEYSFQLGSKAGNAVLKTVENAVNGVELTWEEAENCSNYVIYRKEGSASWKKIGTATGAAFTDKKAKNGKHYSYKVRSANATGNGDYSNEISTVYLIAAKITSLQNSKASMISMKYTANAAADGYEIRIVNDDTEILKKTKNNAVIVGGLDKGTSASVYVRAYKKDGGKTYYSAWSSEKTVSIKK